MANALGRISGQLLKDNLTRNGHDLEFDQFGLNEPVLKLDVNNRYVGVNTDSSARPLQVLGTTRTTNLISTTGLDSPLIDIRDNEIISATDINLSAATQVYADTISTDNIKIYNNVISTTTLNTNLDITPNGNGTLEVYNNLNITGNLWAIETPASAPVITGTIDVVYNSTFYDKYGAYPLGYPPFSSFADTPSGIMGGLIYVPIYDQTQLTFASGTFGSLESTLTGINGETNYTVTVDGVTAVLTTDGLPGSQIYINGDVFSLVAKAGQTLNFSVALGLGSSGGNITLDGNVTFGSDDLDTVSFAADINSDIVPNLDNVYTLGSSTKKWEGIYPALINGQTITAGTIGSAGVNLALRPGNIWFVGTTGDNANQGNHENAAFATLEYALTQAVSGDEIFIYPGTYTEAFPLTVPQGVTIKGYGLRAVTVVPTSGTNTESAFLLNGETTVSDITIKDFYAPGYAFELDTGFETTSRSPYIQNVTVITKGTVTTISDPQGFASGDAGGGAYVDGNNALSTSTSASMLFNSVTFITPGVDALVMTNGVRVEWLDSFTYYANRGLYATNGTLGFAGLAAKFGAEVRGIGSANIYGNYGAVADGDETLMYLISHNFAYIGAGAEDQNDIASVVQANEVVELNDGQIYYESTDQVGNFRIGDIFYVNQETGVVSFDAQAINFTASGSIVLEGPTSTTIIDATKVQTGNIKIYDNNIDSLSGPVNILAFSGTTTLNTDVTVTGNLDITGSIFVDGNVFLGDNPLDTVTIVPKLTQTIEPDQTNLYSLGNSTGPKIWNTLFLSTELNVDNVTSITNNIITTITSGTDLRLVAAGTGIINVTTTDVEITNNLTVNGTVADSQFADVIIGSVGTGSGLTIADDGGGGLVGWSPQALSIAYNPTVISTYPVGSTITFQDGSTATIIQWDDYGPLYIDLFWSTPKTGILFPITLSSGALIGGPENLYLTGDWDPTGAVDRTGNTDITGTLTVNGANTVQFEDIQILGNTITTTVGSNDLELSANGIASLVKSLTSDVEITQDLDVILDGEFGAANVTLGVTLTDLDTANIHIADNTISTVLPINTNLELKAFTGQQVHFVTSDVYIPNDVTVAGPATFNGDSTLLSVEIDGNTTIIGDLHQTVGDTYITGNFNNNNILIQTPSYIEVPDIKVYNNIISVTALNTDLEFRAAGTGGVVFDQQLKIATNVISNIFDVNNLSLSFNNLYLAEDGQLLITEDGDNYLLDLKNDRDLSVIFEPTGTGNVLIDSTKALALAYGNATDRTLEYDGEIRQNSTTKRYEGFTPNGIVSFTDIYDTDGNTFVTAELTPGANDNTIRFGVNTVVNTTITETEMFGSRLTVDNVTISSNTINNLSTTANLEITPNGTGNVLFNTVGFNGNNIINTENNALVLTSTGTGYVKFTGTAGLVLPVGTDSDRSLTPELAETRFNTDKGYVEIFDGTSWISLRGSASTATEEEITAETNLWAFVLG